jgi:flagellar hook-length control protein FliK
MSANLFFSQTMLQPRPGGIEQSRSGGSVQHRSSKAKTTDKSIEDDRESFLNTLRQISKDQDQPKKSSGSELGMESSPKSPVRHSADKPDVNPNSADGVISLELSVDKAPDNIDIENVQVSAFLKIVKNLEASGLLDSSGGSVSPHGEDGSLSLMEDSAVLKELIARMGHNDLEQSAELKNVLERIRQLIANAQAGITASHTNENTQNGPSDKETAVLTNLDQLIKEMISGEEGRKEASGNDFMVTDNSGEKTAKAAANATRMLAELTENYKDRGSAPSAEKSGEPPKTEIGDGSGAIKLTAETRKDAGEAIENAKEPASTAKARPDVSGLEDGAENSAKSRADGSEASLSRVASTMNPGKLYENQLSNNESSHGLKTTDDAQATKDLNQVLRQAGHPVHENPSNEGQAVKALYTGQGHVGETTQENPLNNEPSPVSKIINDAQIARETLMKMEATQSDDFGQKVARIDTGANEGSLLGSQHQSAEKTFEAAGLAKQTEAGHDNLRAHTVDQIVKKAVIQMKSGQHEARIDLKPDFLGHVRMQVTTENHQVTVKILTEFAVVKDMIESNIQQLKSDLQQQGLNVDKLEVSVSNNSDKYQNSRREAGKAKDRLRNIGQKNLKNSEIETGELTENSSLKTTGESTVDYFA